MTDEFFVTLVLGCVIATYVWWLSFTPSGSTEVATYRMSRMAGILSLLIGLIPAGMGLIVLGTELPTLMKPEVRGPHAGPHQIVPFVVLICTVIAGVYLTAAANTFYRPKIAWRLHCVLAVLEGIWIACFLVLLAGEIASGRFLENILIHSLDWFPVLFLCLVVILSLHCFFGFRDTWFAVRARFADGNGKK